ncbi:MAG: hypothetical protein O2V44_00065 [Candidatus Bathyarchaeota archaeon]|nr:hypothetical protein [Candidatus Bathyarchaeota archaeon]
MPQAPATADTPHKSICCIAVVRNTSKKPFARAPARYIVEGVRGPLPISFINLSSTKLVIEVHA